MILEQSGVLFCALPLINRESKHLIDHISVSITFATLQAIIKQFSRENRLSSLEDFICSVMPFGTFVGDSFGCLLNKPSTGLSTAGVRKQEDAVIAIKTSEYISTTSGSGQETVYGTVAIESSPVSGEKGALVLKVNQLDLLNPVLSPHCSRVDEDKIQIKLSERFLKYFHYKCEPKALEKVCPFLVYSYKLSRSQEQRNVWRVELMIQLKSTVAVKFSFCNIQFKHCFGTDAAKVINSTLNWGQLHVERPAGLFWILGSKFPKSGRIQLTADILCSEDRTDFAEALLNFRAENFSLGLRLSGDCIGINDHVFPNSKLLSESSLSSFDYKLQPIFE
jgi:hypothetical protein